MLRQYQSNLTMQATTYAQLLKQAHNTLTARSRTIALVPDGRCIIPFQNFVSQEYFEARFPSAVRDLVQGPGRNGECRCQAKDQLTILS